LVCSEKINCYDKEDIMTQIRQYLHKKHWLIKEDSGCKVIYRPPITQLFFVEKIIINVSGNEILLTGSKYYLNKLLNAIFEE
jgi:hypothetical protein